MSEQILTFHISNLEFKQCWLYLQKLSKLGIETRSSDFWNQPIQYIVSLIEYSVYVHDSD